VIYLLLIPAVILVIKPLDIALISQVIIIKNDVTTLKMAMFTTPVTRLYLPHLSRTRLPEHDSEVRPEERNTVILTAV
jgi:hypothetical protein